MKRSWLALLLGILVTTATPLCAQGPIESTGGEAPEGVPGPPIPADLMAPGFRPNLNVWEEEPIVPEEPWVLFGVEYLRYWQRKDDYSNIRINNLPAGDPLFTPLAGGGLAPQKALNGGRATLIFFPTSPVPIEVSGFWVHEHGGPLFLSPPLTAVRVVQAVNLGGAPEEFPAGVPGVTAGSSGIDFRSDLYGGEGNVYVTRNVFIGGRYLALDESTDVYNNNAPFADAFGTTLVTDHIGTSNQLYGGQIGVRCDFNMGPILIELKTKMLMGYMRRTTDIVGNTISVDAAGQAIATAGGIQAVPSNQGNFKDSKFSYVPEFNANMQIPVFDWFQVVVGYNFLYWQDVVRPGEQYDRNVDTRQVPTSPNFVAGSGAALPTFQNRRSDYWVHGLNVGVAFVY